MVAERRSVSAAAKVLYVTQPALTTRIKNLERELGIDLFVRTPRGMRLTAEGRGFRPHAQRAVQSLAEGRELLRELGEGRVGELIVGAAPAISTYVLPLVLRRFQALFPNVHLIVRTGHSEEVLELVLREQVQIGLVRELPHPAVSSVPLYDDEIVLVVDPGHRFAGAPSIDVNELERGAADPLRPHLQLLRTHERVLPGGGRRPARRDGARQRRRDQEDGRARARDRLPALHGCSRRARDGDAARGGDPGVRAGATPDRRAAPSRCLCAGGPRRRARSPQSTATSSNAEGVRARQRAVQPRSITTGAPVKAGRPARAGTRPSRRPRTVRAGA